MKRYERIGFPEKRLELDLLVNWFANAENLKVKFENAWWGYSALTQDATHISVFAFLIDDLSLARLWAQRSLDYASQHFWGDWRDQIPTGNSRNGPPSREYQDINAPWDTPFQCALLCGSCLGDWDWLARLGRFFRDDIRLHTGKMDSNWSWYFLAAGVLRDRPWSELTAFFDKTQNSPQKREKLLARLLASIVHGLEEDRAKATKEYFTNFKRSERKSDNITIMLPWDASFLVHYAKHVGKPLPVPPDVVDYVIDLGEPSSSNV